MKRDLEAEGFGEVYAQSVQLKRLSQDGKQRVTDAADTKTLLRIIQYFNRFFFTPYRLLAAISLRIPWDDPRFT